MKKMLFLSVLFLLCIILPVSIFSQGLNLEDSREFFTDIEGHHGLGKAEGATESEAIRMAKAEGISKVFTELSKDDMFAEIFISRWPEAIVVEDSVFEAVEDGSYKAVVRVKIDQQAILLTEQTYQDSAINLLDRAEKLLDEAEPQVEEAQGHEENMQLGEAYTKYKQTESRLNEVILLLAPLGDSSLQSSEGNSKPSVMNIATTLKQTVAAGLDRLAQIEKETEVSETAEQIRQTFDLLLTEETKARDVADKYLPVSPFYDLPEARLEAVLLEIRQAIELNKDIGIKLSDLKTGVPADKVFLIQKIELSCTETEQLDETLGRLEMEVKEEIRVPRLVRQERAYKLNLFKENLVYALVKREPKDTFFLRYYLPFGFDTGENARGGLTHEFEFETGVEYYFSDLVWFQTAIWKDDSILNANSDGVPELTNIALSQEVHLGFGRKFIFGGGASWDWGRWVAVANGTNGTENTPGDFSINALVGGIDAERGWPWGTLMLKFPARPGAFLFLEKPMIGLDVKLRVSILFQIEAGIGSGFIHHTAAEDIDTAIGSPGEYLQYQMRFYGGFGVRLPKPFLWGLRFEGGSSADVTGETVGESEASQMQWRFFIQYSL